MSRYLKKITLSRLPGDYTAQIPAVQSLFARGGMEFKQPVTFFTGENGMGKSTLLEAIAVAMGFPPEGGSRDFMFSTRDTHAPLGEFLILSRARLPGDGFFLRAESFYNVASYLEENSTMARYGGRSLHRQSHGESFLSLVINRFAGGGIYLLDEPEAALSPLRSLSLVAAMDDLVKRDSQFIIATHSPLLLAYPKAEILEFSETGFRAVDYRETGSYQIMRDFIHSPERMMRELLGDCKQ